jgi:hypothetical protein
MKADPLGSAFNVLQMLVFMPTKRADARFVDARRGFEDQKFSACA